MHDNNKNNNHNEVGNELFTIEQQPVACRYTVYLNSVIERQSSYIHLFELFRKATPNDVIYFHINCEGGNVTTGVQILSAMTDCDATVVTVLDGVAHSMATFLFLSGDQMVVNNYSTMMFHNFSTGFFPSKGNEIASQVDAYTRMFEQLMIDKIYPFLSIDEIKQIKRGTDIWCTTDEIEERLEAFVEYKNEMAQEKQEKFDEDSLLAAQKFIDEHSSQKKGSKKGGTSGKGRTASRKKSNTKNSVSQAN